MKNTPKSIFNLIEIFRREKVKRSKKVNALTHCEEKSLHDYYCDGEKPFVSNNNA
jgi:hypothetical protein